MQRVPIDDLKKTLQKNEFYAYLIGDGPYKYNSPYVDIPTDVDYVVTAIRDYYNQGHPEIMSLFKENIVTLSKDRDLGWFAVYYLDAYLSLPGNLHATDDAKAFAETVFRHIARFKDTLVDNQQWIGCNMKHGLWGAFTYMTSRITNAHPNLKIDIDFLRIS